MFKGETVSTGAAHPGTPLQVLKSAAGYYIGYLDTDGCPYSRESGYFPTQEAAQAALDDAAPHELEELAKDRYLCDIEPARLIVSIESMPRDRRIAIVEITRYQMRVNGCPRYHDLVFRETVCRATKEGGIGEAIAVADRFLNRHGVRSVRLVAGSSL